MIQKHEEAAHTRIHGDPKGSAEDIAVCWHCGVTCPLGIHYSLRNLGDKGSDDISSPSLFQRCIMVYLSPAARTPGHEQPPHLENRKGDELEECRRRKGVEQRLHHDACNFKRQRNSKGNAQDQPCRTYHSGHCTGFVALVSHDRENWSPHAVSLQASQGGCASQVVADAALGPSTWTCDCTRWRHTPMVRCSRHR